MGNSLDISFSFSWDSIRKRDDNEYLYPNAVNLLDPEHNIPAIYKWSVFKPDIEDSKIVYIGETEKLINRIRGYLNPGPTQQTNKRINKFFNEYLDKGYRISLHTLSFNEIKLNNIIIKYNDIFDHDIRKALEQLFIVIYKKEEYTLLNR